MHKSLNQSHSKTWKYWIDVGGTFTDYVAQSPDGIQVNGKIPSSGHFYGTAEILNQHKVRFTCDLKLPSLFLKTMPVVLSAKEISQELIIIEHQEDVLTFDREIQFSDTLLKVCI